VRGSASKPVFVGSYSPSTNHTLPLLNREDMTGMKIRTTIIFLQNEEVSFPSTPMGGVVVSVQENGLTLRGGYGFTEKK
jgi:hypothetical protein